MNPHERDLKPMTIESSNDMNHSSPKRVLMYSLMVVGFFTASFWLGTNFASVQDSQPTSPPTVSAETSARTVVSPPPTESPVTQAPTGSPVPQYHGVGFDIAEMRQKAVELQKMLDDYYGETRMHVAAMSARPDTPNFKDQIEYISDKMVRSLVHENDFVIGVIGSSVAAGHDNCHYDAYEGQLERLMAPVWSVTGKTFVVRNAGEGGGCGDTQHNQVFCFLQLVGYDVDIVHYSWTYFEHNTKHSDNVHVHESLIRWALMTQRTPAMQMLYAHGDENCYDTVAPESDTYSKFGFGAVCLASGLRASPGYRGKKWGLIGDGLHNSTRYGEPLDQTRKDSLGTVWRNWHPGPLGFQLVSDSFGYTYLSALLRALDKIEQAEKERKILADVWAVEAPVLVQGDLPKPVKCDGSGYPCLVETAPSCTSFETPIFGYTGVPVADVDDDLNPFADEQKKGSWEVVRGRPTSAIPKKERFKPECKHDDRCGGIEGRSGLVAFKIPKADVGAVIVCCRGVGKKAKECAEPQLLNNKLSFIFDGKKLDPATFDIWPNRKCLRVLKEFPATMEDSSGHPYLGIRAETNSTFVSISQVIVY